MNSCEPYQELISRLVDGEISREEHKALMAHLNTCSRCNAMYAVFHDLSDILSEEPEELPEGLHENIMASVRRSEMMKKNRRMRKLGLRMAMSAAACALLVLFAASGFGPGRRAEDASLRTQEAAEQLYQAPATPAPTDDVFLLPAQTQAPTPVQTPAPTETPAAFAVPDAYLAAGNSVSEPASTTLQRPNYVQYTAPPAAQTAAPAQITPDVYYYVGDSTQTGTGIYYPSVTAAPVQTAAPVAAQTAAPTVAESPAPAAVESAAPLLVQNTAPAAVESGESADKAEPEVEAEETPVLFSLFSSARRLFSGSGADDTAAGTASSDDVVIAAVESPVPAAEENAAPLLMQRSAPAAVENAASAEPETDEKEAPMLFSSFGTRMLLTAEPEETVEMTSPEELIDSSVPAAEESAAPLLMQRSAPAVIENTEPVEIVISNENSVNDIPEEKTEGGELQENPAARKVGREPEEQRISLWGRDAHDKLFALLDGSESELPAEAELTRVVHVALWPDDAYGSEEKLDIHIYGDFVYYSLYPAESGAVSYRAACALRDLDSLLKTLTSVSAEPSPSPTVDPYAVEIATA